MCSPLTEYLESMFSLEGRTAVVTGGGGVLCSRMAEAHGPGRRERDPLGRPPGRAQREGRPDPQDPRRRQARPTPSRWT